MSMRGKRQVGRALARIIPRQLWHYEVIESVLGTLKCLEQQQARSGFTGLILGLCFWLPDGDSDLEAGAGGLFVARSEIPGRPEHFYHDKRERSAKIRN